MKNALWSLFLLLLIGCGQKPRVTPAEAIIDLALIPSGTYAIKSVEIAVTRYANRSSAVMKQVFHPGVIDDRNNDFSVSANWDPEEKRHFLYAFLNLPSALEATGSRVIFLSPRFYSPYADKLNGAGRAVVWEDVGGLLFHHAYSRGKKRGLTYEVTLQNNFLPDDSATVSLFARRITENEIKLEFEATFHPPATHIPPNFPGKYIGQIRYVRR